MLFHPLPKSFSIQTAFEHYLYFLNRLITNCQYFRVSLTFGVKSIYILFITEFRPFSTLKLLKTKRNLVYIRKQSVPRCKHFSSWL
jgi:hypothetical protein